MPSRTLASLSIAALLTSIAALLTACGNVAAVDTTEPLEVREETRAVIPPASALTPTEPEIDNLKPEQGTSQAFQIEPVILHAEPYMLADYTPQHSTLIMECNLARTISLSVVTNSVRPRISENGLMINGSSEILGRSFYFWQTSTVFFDGTLMEIPPMYENISKQVEVRPGHFEPRNERRLLRPFSAIDGMLFQKLKSAKMMRLGSGPSFDLTTMKNDIETLEAQCASQEAN